MNQFDIYRSFATVIASIDRKLSDRPGVSRRLVPWMLALVPVASHALEVFLDRPFHITEYHEIYTDVDVMAEDVLIFGGTIELVGADDDITWRHFFNDLTVQAGNPDNDGRSLVLVQTTPDHDLGIGNNLRVDNLFMEAIPGFLEPKIVLDGEGVGFTYTKTFRVEGGVIELRRDPGIDGFPLDGQCH